MTQFRINSTSPAQPVSADDNANRKTPVSTGQQGSPKPTPDQFVSSAGVKNQPPSSQEQMRNLLAIAKRRSANPSQDGWSLGRVFDFLLESRKYGKLYDVLPEASNLGTAHYFEQYLAGQNLAKLGLKKLDVKDLVSIPPGALVIFNNKSGLAGRNGNIAVAGDRGTFYNGATLNYAGRIPPAGTVSAYVPAD